MYCKFGLADRVPATFISSNELQCVAPAHRRAVTKIQLSPYNVSLAEEENADAMTFRYRRPDLVSSIVPAQAESTGGTVVKVMSTNTPDDGYAMWRFGGTTVVAARKASMGIIEGVAPALLSSPA